MSAVHRASPLYPPGQTQKFSLGVELRGTNDSVSNMQHTLFLKLKNLAAGNRFFSLALFGDALRGKPSRSCHDRNPPGLEMKLVWSEIKSFIDANTSLWNPWMGEEGKRKKNILELVTNLSLHHFPCMHTHPKTQTTHGSLYSAAWRLQTQSRHPDAHKWTHIKKTTRVADSYGAHGARAIVRC